MADDEDEVPVSDRFVKARSDPLKALKQAKLLNSKNNDSNGKPSENLTGDDDLGILGEASRNTMVKRVSWVEGVAESKSAHIAISIPRHKYVESGEFVFYTMELWRSGRSWTLRKRYSDFFRFHENLLNEDLIDPGDLPRLPKKRWFNWIRWSNRFDDKFTSNRRIQLQEYIRAIVKVDVLVSSSRALHGFLEINRSLAIDPEDRAKNGDEDDDRNSFYYDISSLAEN